MSVYKDTKRNTWYARVRYTDWTGKRKETTKRGFATKREAKEWEDEKRAVSVDSSDMTLQDLYDKFIADRRARCKESTVHSVEGTCRVHILPTLGEKKLTDIDTKTIRQWQNRMLEKNLSEGYLRKISVHFTMLLNFAVKYYGLSSNPVQTVGNIGRSSTRLEFWEKAEFDKFLAALPNSDLKLFFTILYVSGMRIGEFLALTPQDVDYTNNKITVGKTYNLHTHRVGTPKTDTSFRTIAMPPTVIRQIRKYAETFPNLPERLFSLTNRDKLSRVIKQYAPEAGIPTINLHGLRHSHASLLIRRGVPLPDIAKRLGHKNAGITLSIYSHFYKDSDEEIAADMEKLFFCGQNVVTDQ